MSRSSLPVQHRTLRTLRRAIAVVFLAACTIVTGCQCHENWITTIRFDRDTERFDVEVRLQNVSGGLLNCDDLDSCRREIYALKQLAGQSHLARHIMKLPQQGAANTEVSFEINDDRMDVIIHFQAYPGTEAADLTRVQLVREYHPNGEVFAQLMVPRDLGDEHWAGRYHRRLHTYAGAVERDGEAHTQILQTFVLQGRPSAHQPSTRGRTPILRTVPGLAELLMRDEFLAGH